MSKAKSGKELHAVTENKVGMMAEISQWLADKGVNIKAVCAYVVEDKAHFLMVTSDNKKATDILKSKEIEVTEDEVVVVEMADKVGALKDMAKKLKNSEIDIKHIYGSTPGVPNALATIVFNSDDNKKAINCING